MSRYQGSPEGRAAYQLADAFCRQARLRAEELFGRLWENTDDIDHKVVKGILGGDVCGVVPCPGVEGGAASASTDPTTATTAPAPTSALPPVSVTPAPESESDLGRLLEKLLGA